MQKYMPNLHTRIKENRKKLGLSQSDLAIRCGVSQPTVANWERGGHVPRHDALQKIADCLGVDSVWLLSGELPANQGPSHKYLNTPIRHIPIYDWHDDARSFANSSPVRYVSLAIEPEDVFAISAPRNEEFTSETTLVFDRKAKLAANTRFLARDGRKLTLVHASDIDGSDLIPLARLIYSMRAH